MATERYGVGTYREFADGVLPRIQKLGCAARLREAAPCCRRTGADPGCWQVQLRAADGSDGARVLRQLRLPRHQLLCRRASQWCVPMPRQPRRSRDAAASHAEAERSAVAAGTPEDFKYLVDKAHSMGIRVIMDIVHRHASAHARPSRL